MTQVIAGFAMSLDGYIADAEDGVHLLFQWLAGGDVAVPIHDRTFMTSAVSAACFQQRVAATGAMVTGRRDFDVSRAWGGKPPIDVPVFIVTHSPPPEWTGKDGPFTFVTAGVEQAIAQAQEAVRAQARDNYTGADKVVLVSGSQIVQQCIEAGRLDELHIDLVPVLLGKGIRLFEQLAIDPQTLTIIDVAPAPNVTHLRYRFPPACELTNTK